MAVIGLMEAARRAGIKAASETWVLVYLPQRITKVLQ